MKPFTRLYRGQPLLDSFGRDKKTVRAGGALEAARMLGGNHLIPKYLTVVATGEELELKNGEYVTRERA